MFEIIETPEQRTAEDRTYKIYRLTSMDNGKVYIGVTKKSIKSRWSGHVSNFNTNMDKSLPLNRLQKAFRAHGVINWTKELLVGNLSREEAFEEEIRQIAKHESFGKKGYNATSGGVGQNHVQWSEYSKQKLSESQKVSWENKDYKPSEITRKRMSDAKKLDHPRAVKVVFRGVEYSSYRDAERQTGVSLCRIKSELADPEYMLYPHNQQQSKAGRKPRPYATTDGVFDTRKLAADHYKVSIHNLAGYLRRNGLEVTQPK
jgi:hypothetical protein